MTAETPTCKLCGLPMKRPLVWATYLEIEGCPLGPDDSLAHKEIIKRNNAIKLAVEALEHSVPAYANTLLTLYGKACEIRQKAFIATAPFIRIK